ncbi:formate/nitrite transporter family protein [Sphingomonas fuzhouensis]|uniref:formate/nitrite transporter family protein n=1 Tax=Sphingomonas fuzhouensis TaxID=3106033 RepID=UPI002AFF2EFF|nr:formate/nitrite transporter family protein [Sphingomonas sp. SGZ-02]
MADTSGEPLAATVADALAERGEAGIASILWLGIAAGVQIGFGGIAYLVASAGMPSGAGATHLLAGLAFSSGLMLVMVTGAHLFTGHAMLSLPLAQGRVTGMGLVKALGLVWLANLIGSLIVVGLFIAAGGPEAMDGTVAAVARETAMTKVAKPGGTLIASGILANMLVCLGVWMASGATTVAGKIVAVIAPVTLFVAAGFEHSIANMTLLPLGWALDPAEVSLGGIAHNLALSTLGNLIGGGAIALLLGAGHGALKKRA